MGKFTFDSAFDVVPEECVHPDTGEGVQQGDPRFLEGGEFYEQIVLQRLDSQIQRARRQLAYVGRDTIVATIIADIVALGVMGALHEAQNNQNQNAELSIRMIVVGVCFILGNLCSIVGVLSSKKDENKAMLRQLRRSINGHRFITPDFLRSVLGDKLYHRYELIDMGD